MGLTGKSRQRQLLCGPRAACLRRFVAQTVLGEFGIALAFALLGRTLRRDSWWVAVAAVAGGVSIFVCYAAAFLITDSLIS
jgi:hypothetical protein